MAAAPSEEVRLDRVAPGTEVALEPIPGWETKWVFATVLHHGVGSSTVAVYPDGKHLTWAPETVVIPLTEDEMAKPVSKTAQRNVPAPVVDEKLRQALITRFKLQCSNLISNDNKKNATAAMMMPRVLGDAMKAEFALPLPSVLGIEGIDDHEIFEGYGFDDTPIEGVTPPAPVAASKKVTAKAAKAANGEAKPKREKAPPKEQTPCLDGCGETTGGRFRPGHDAKLKSLLHKVERGEATPDDVPEVAQPLIAFKKGPVETKGTGDKATKIQTYILTKSPVKLPGRADITYV